MPGEVLVRFRPGHELAAASAPQWLGAPHVERLAAIGVYRIRLAPGRSVWAAIRQLQSLPSVEFAEPNYRVRADTTPNDPEFGPRQSHLRRIRCEQGWDLNQGNSSIVIAIVDTGVDLDHPDMSGKLVPGYDFENGDPVPDDDNGHGTHTAGLAAAATNNDTGIAGVGWSCRIMPVKALDSDGNGSVATIANALNFAANNGANVISLSLGTKSNSATLQAAVLNAQAHNAVVVASAGNSGNQVATYPAAYPHAIAVAASTDADLRADFSNYGNWVDVAAPGVNVYSSYKNGGYKYMSGTSMSTPMVAGLAALLWSQLGTAVTCFEIRARIEDNCVPVGAWVQKGRIDVERALLNLGPPHEVRRTEAPTNFGVEFGDLIAGSLASLAVDDDDRVDLAAVRIGNGRRASLWAAAAPSWSGQRVGIEVGVEASSSPGGLVKIALWNWDLARWDTLATRSAGSGDRMYRSTTNTPDPYLGPDDEIRIQASRLEGRNRTFRLRVDRVEITSISLE